MTNFEFCSPTKIIFGKDSLLKLGDEILNRGFKKVLLVYGSDRIEKNGILDIVKSELEKANASWVVLKGVRPNPRAEEVRIGTKLAKENKVDLILAIGGGSPIDTAKCIACGYFYDGDPFDFNLYKAEAKKALPIGVVLTISSAGSETSNSCVIQDDKIQKKNGFLNNLFRPIFSIEDPTFTISCPPYQTAAGISDTIMHSLERYFAKSGNYELCDDFALAVIKRTMEAGLKVMEEPSNYDARAAVMLCSSLSHNGLTSIGKDWKFVVHPIEHGLSGYKSDITHGAGVALIYPAWAEYVYKYDLNKFSHLTKFLFNKQGANDEETAIIGIDLFREFFSKIGMPTCLKDVGLTEKDIPLIADLVTNNGTREIGQTSPKSLDREDIKNILLKLS